MLREHVRQVVASAIEALKTEGELPADLDVPVQIDDPKNPEHGDFACNFALIAAKPAGMNPRAVAELLAAKLQSPLPLREAEGEGVGGGGSETQRSRPRIQHSSTSTQDSGPAPVPRPPSLLSWVEVAGPGFLNIRLNPEAVGAYVSEILRLGVDLPKATNAPKYLEGVNRQSSIVDAAPKRGIDVEFVSVNPNGPITVGSGRGAAFGDTLCRVFEAAGDDVTREYYINDGVNSEQMRLFAKSVRHYYLELSGRESIFPDRGYRGEYVRGVAERLKQAATHRQRINLEQAPSLLCLHLFEILSAQGSLGSPELRRPTCLISLEIPKGNVAAIVDTQRLKEASADPQFRRSVAGVEEQCELIAGNGKLKAVVNEAPEFTKQLLPALAFLFARDIQEQPLVFSLAEPFADILLEQFIDILKVRNERHLMSSAETQASKELGFLATAALQVASTMLGRQLTEPDLAVEYFQRESERLMIQRQTEDLHLFGVNFDVWFSEQSLHDNGKVAETLLKLERAGTAYKSYKALDHAEDEVAEPESATTDEQREGAPGRAGESDAGSPRSKGSAEGSSTPLPPSSSRQSRDEEGDGVSTSGVGSADFIVPSDQESNLSIDKHANRPPNQHTDSEPEGEALWLASHTKGFGDDKDRVLVRADGRPAYIAADVAYLDNKLGDRNFDKAYLILGPDHHGYIGRMYAAYQALGYPMKDGKPERFEIIIFQIVRFVKDGKPAPMRKRDGNIYELRDLINELGKNIAPKTPLEEQQRIGADVSRFFYLMRSHDSHMDFDIDLATKQSDENPVFYVQYACARICSVITKARDAGFTVSGSFGVTGDSTSGDSASVANTPNPTTAAPQDYNTEANASGKSVSNADTPSPNTATPQPRNTASNPPTLQHSNAQTPELFDPSLLTHPREIALIKKILDLPDEVKRCAEDYGVHRLTTYAIELARTYHHFYDVCRVIQLDEPELSQARLALCEAARIGLQSTLDLLGVSAPERMEREPV